MSDQSDCDQQITKAESEFETITPTESEGAEPSRQADADQVLSIALDNRQREANRCLKQGMSRYQAGQFRLALHDLQQAQTLYLELGDQSGAQKALSSLGLTFYSLGDYRQAIDCSQRSLPPAQKIKNCLSTVKVLEPWATPIGICLITTKPLNISSKAWVWHEKFMTAAEKWPL